MRAMHAALPLLATTATVAFGSAVGVAPAVADPVSQLEICRAPTNGMLVTAGQSWVSGPDGKPQSVPDKMNVSLSRSATLFPPPPGSTWTATVNWRNTATGASGTEQQTRPLGSGGVDAWFRDLPTGAGLIEISADSTAHIPFPLSGACTGQHEIH